MAKTVRPLTLEEVKSTVHENDFIWVFVWGEHYECQFDQVFCLQVRFIHDEMIEFCTIWDEFCLYFQSYGNTWAVYTDNPSDYIAGIPV